MSLLMEALRKAEEAKRRASDRSDLETGRETTAPGSENTVLADSGQSDSDRIYGTYPALGSEDHAIDGPPENPTVTAQSAHQVDTPGKTAPLADPAATDTTAGAARGPSRDQQSANAVFLAKQTARRRRQQRQRMTVLLGLLVLLPAGGGLFYFWQTRIAAPDGITTPASLTSRPAGEFLDTGTPAAESFAGTLTANDPAEPASAPGNDPMPGENPTGSESDGSDPAGSDATVSDREPDDGELTRAEGGSGAGDGTDNDSAVTAEAQTSTPPGTAGQPAENATDPSLRLSRRDSTLIVTPELSAAYEHFLSGDLAAATVDYLQALEDDPRNREAMLGLATIYRRQGDTPGAQRLYARLLELNPRDPLARTGLIEAARSADPLQRESDLRQLLEAYPALAPVSFALGNLHASQGRWREAQNAYFDALRKARDSGGGPISPDYAFNLAISLERLGESELALDYYREAETLARGAAPGFDMKILHQRLQALQ